MMLLSNSGGCLRLVLTRIVLGAALASPSFATDYWVDPVGGDDTNSGLTAADAWRHASHALSIAVLADDVVHLGPGVYDAANGESFPLPITLARVVGTAGSEHTIIDGGGFHAAGPIVDIHLRLEGLSIRNTDFGIFAFHPGYPYDAYAELTDLHISGMSEYGILIDGYGSDSGYQVGASAILQRVRVENCNQFGIAVRASSTEGSDTCIFMTDCVVRGCSIAVDGLANADYYGFATGTLQRCRIIENGWGVDVDGVGGALLRLEDCLVADNSTWGLRGNEIEVVRSTIANNGTVGLQAFNAGAVNLVGSIFHGNGDDIVSWVRVNATHSRVDDPAVLPDPSNTTADPGFIDAGAGDFRLSYGSPCIDRGPDEAAASLDLRGRSRQVDGDLDTIERADMGALEFAPLELVGEPRLGATVTLEMRGPGGGAASLYFAPARLLDPPEVTPLGELDLMRSLMVHREDHPLVSGAPTRLWITLPSDPAQVGRPYSLQAFVRGAGPTNERALSNALYFELLP